MPSVRGVQVVDIPRTAATWMTFDEDLRYVYNLRFPRMHISFKA